MTTSTPDLFTTLRYIPSTSSDGPSADDVPLFDLHVQRLKTSFRQFSGLVEQDDNTPFWHTRIWNALKNVIVEKGASRGLRLKVTVAISSPPTFSAEAWILPDSFPPFTTSLPVARSTASSSLPQVTLSPSPIEWTEDTLPLLLHKTSDRRIYDQHTALTVPNHPSTQSTLLYTSPPDSLITETTITNVLFLPPASSTWITPRITPTTPLLPGLMREDLLNRGEIEEADIRLEDLKAWLADGRGGRVACCNALRGVWEVRIEFGLTTEA